MKKRGSFATMRYVLVVRDAELRRLAVCATPRSLVDLTGLLKSLFAQYPAAAAIEVVLFGWPQGQTVDEQEVMVSAQRSSGGPGPFLWYSVYELRRIEQDIAEQAAVLADAEREVRP